MLLTLAAFGVPLGLWIDSSHRQAATVGWLEHHWVDVRYLGDTDELDEEGKGWKLDPSHPLRNRLERVIGRDFLRPAISASIDDEITRDPRFPEGPNQVALEALGRLRELPTVRTLDVDLPEGGDAHLAAIGRLGSLERLTVWLGPITCDGLRALGGLPHLRELEIDAPRLTEAHLAVIGQWTNLEALSVSTEDSPTLRLQPLARLRRLRRLEVHSPEWTGAGLHLLPAFPQLRELRLSGTRVGDAKMRWVADCQSLEALYLGPSITDAGLDHLRSLRKLHHLEFFESRVTINGLRRFLRRSACYGAVPRRTDLAISLESAPAGQDLADLAYEFPYISFWRGWGF